MTKILRVEKRAWGKEVLFAPNPRFKFNKLSIPASQRMILILFTFLCNTLQQPAKAAIGHPPRTGICAKAQGLSHATWDALLQRHVRADGLVDYKGMLRDSTALNTYLQLLSRHVPGEGAPREDRLAYYINLYNAATVKLILENYPVKSIRDLPHPWDREWIPAGGQMLSLGQIEHQVLRKMGDPRIHFAINCASLSCPKLGKRAYTADDIDRQLDTAAREFINDPEKNHINGDKLGLSRLFQWYKKDFTTQGSLRAFIRRYSRTEVAPGAKITFLKYDWSLNDIN